MKDYGLGWSEELEEWNYVRSNFKFVDEIGEIDTRRHDTIIFIDYKYEDSERRFKEYSVKLDRQGEFSHSRLIIEWQGLRILFKSREQVLERQGLRGYDKRKTVLISSGVL